MGIEAAIVLIAFVLVASALAFVVLNMGMFTTQKTKEVIARAYEESTRAIDIAGNVKAKVDATSGTLQLVAIPIKLTSGARPIDLNKTVVAITVIFPDGTAAHVDNGYVFINKTIITDKSKGTGVLLQTFQVIKNFGSESPNITEGLENELAASWFYVRSEDKYKPGDPEGRDVGKCTEVMTTIGSDNIEVTRCEPGDELLEPGEIVLLVFMAPEGTRAYSRIIVEIKPPQGATVTVERIVPPKLDSDYVDLDIG